MPLLWSSSTAVAAMKSIVVRRALHCVAIDSIRRSSKAAKLSSFQWQRQQVRQYSAPDGTNGPPNNHELFEAQTMELEKERISIFGSNDDEPLFDNQVTTTTRSGSVIETDEKAIITGRWAEERDAAYNFGPDEISAWKQLSSFSTTQIDTIKVIPTMTLADHEQQRVAEATRDLRLKEEERIVAQHSRRKSPLEYSDGRSLKERESETKLTHVTPSGDQVCMVDVGSKPISRRVARARSVVWFPPEVMQVIGTEAHPHEEFIGPKGPIFATAKLAGIMGAKRTSELIPLCHPIGLDKVHVEIRLDGNRAIVECECCVTHKTGVEMEALTGATIAALTIYDMVKAISHDVRIESTKLISKTGGKRDVVEK